MTVTRATVAGSAVPDDRLGDENQPSKVTFFAPPPAGIDVTLAIGGEGPVSMRVMDASAGLEDLPGFKPSSKIGVLFDDHATGSA